MNGIDKSFHLVWLIFLFILPHETDLIGQVNFQKTYGHTDGNEANAVISTNDGGYAIAGWYDVDGLFSAEFYLVVTDAVGDTLWTKTYGSASEANAHSINGSGNEGYSLMQTEDDGFLFIGERHFVTGGQSDAYVIKVSNDGTLEWSKIYGGLDNDYGYKAIQTDDGDYVIAGFTESFGSGVRDMYLFKIDSQGEVLWNKTYGGDSIDAAFDMLETPEGGYLLVGYTFSFSGSSDVYVICTDENGEPLWQKTYGGELNDIGHSIQQSQEGGYLICGETESYGQGEADFYVIKIDSDGNLEWSNAYGGQDYETGRSITQSSSGDYSIVGSTRSFGKGREDVFMVIIDQLGNLRWAHTFGGMLDDAGRSIQTTDDGGYIIAGFTKSYGAGFSDMYLIKTDSNGNSGCEQESNNTISTEANSQETIVSSTVSEGITFIIPNTRVGNTSTRASDPCEISSIDDLTPSDDEFILYPNPVNDVLTIESESSLAATQGHLNIYNGLGQIVMTQQLTSNTVDISAISQGIYVVKLQIDNSSFSYKLLKN